jgi:thiosulfate/3-mercaptopyruvate sulfurtransferase
MAGLVSGYTRPEALVSTEWLARHLSAPDVRVVDGSWYLPAMHRDAKAEFAAARIPGAVFFDIDEIADTSSPLPHMLPTPEKFSARVRKLGLGDGNRIIVYDGAGIFSAPRVWWMFRVFGHEDVAVLDGGLPKWRHEGRPLASDAGVPRDRHFTARVNSLLVRDLEQLRRNLTSAREQVLDARSRGRFFGTEPEPRPGLRSGHIPGAKNLPWNDLVDPEANTMLPAAALAERFKAAGIDPQKPTVCSCGSGISACTLALGLHLLGARQVAVYDGSWTEWGGRQDTPVALSDDPA